MSLGYLTVVVTLSLFSLFTITQIQNQDAFAHRDLPSDGKAYQTIVTLKQISFYDGMTRYDVLGDDDYVFGWKVEMTGHPSATSTGTFVDDESTGAILRPNIVVLDHIECGPKSNLQFYGWGAESDQDNILGTDKLMRDIISNPVSAGSKTTSKHVFESNDDNFIGFNSDRVSADSRASDELFEERLFLNADRTVALQFLIDRQTLWDDTDCEPKTVSENSKKPLTKQGNNEKITKDKKKNQDAKDTTIKDDLKSLYKITKLYESTATSLSSVNDQQKTILQKATSAANKDLTKEQKEKLKPLLKEQDTDKKDIRTIQDSAKKLSSEIKKYAQKQGIKTSELDKITKIQKDGNRQKQGPINQLKQDAANAKNNLDEARKLQKEHEEELQIGAQLLGHVLDPGTLLTKFRQFGFEGLYFEQIPELLEKHRNDLTKSEISTLEEQYANYQEGLKKSREESQKILDEQSKERIDRIFEQLIELAQRTQDAQKKEQEQTDSILNTIPENFQDSFKPPTNQGKIQLQSKRGSYIQPDDPCKSRMVVIMSNWVLAKSSGIDSGQITVFHLDLGSPQKIPKTTTKNIDDGVIQYSDYAYYPGTSQLWLGEINGRQVENSMIEIKIPDLCVTVAPPPVIADPTGDFKPVVDTKPILTIPKQITEEATSSSGKLVEYTPIGLDREDGSLTPVCNPPSPSIFPIGTTTVTCTVTDSKGNSVSGTFTVTIRDTTPPDIPAFQPREGVKDESGIQVFYDVTATDLVDGTVQVECNYPSGYKFLIGTTVLTCTAMDSHGNKSSRSLQITVTSTQSGQ